MLAACGRQSRARGRSDGAERGSQRRRTFLPATDSRPLMRHSLRPVPRMMASYSWSIAPRWSASAATLGGRGGALRVQSAEQACFWPALTRPALSDASGPRLAALSAPRRRLLAALLSMADAAHGLFEEEPSAAASGAVKFVMRRRGLVRARALPAAAAPPSAALVCQGRSERALKRPGRQVTSDPAGGPQAGRDQQQRRGERGALLHARRGQGGSACAAIPGAQQLQWRLRRRAAAPAAAEASCASSEPASARSAAAEVRDQPPAGALQRGAPRPPPCTARTTAACRVAQSMGRAGGQIHSAG